MDEKIIKLQTEIVELKKSVEMLKGGPGSGNFDHAGIPGQVGGSAGGRGGGGEEGRNTGTKVSEFTSKYEKDLLKTSKSAFDKNIKASTDKDKVTSRAREASSVINSQRKSGYTVYSSDSPAYSVDKDDNVIDHGNFPMVAYGSGESPRAVNQMIGILRDNGYYATKGPQDYGIIVGHPSWK